MEKYKEQIGGAIALGIDEKAKIRQVYQSFSSTIVS